MTTTTMPSPASTTAGRDLGTLSVLTWDELGDAYCAAVHAGEDGAPYVAEAKRRERAERAMAAKRSNESAWDSAAFAQYLAADAYACGNLLSAAGKRRNRDAWPMLWQGNEQDARRLASDELIRFWDYQSPRVPSPAALARAQRNEQTWGAEQAAEPEPKPAAWQSVPGGRIRPAEVAGRAVYWAIGASGQATLHPSRPAALAAIAPGPAPTVPAMRPGSIARFTAALETYTAQVDSMTARLSHTVTQAANGSRPQTAAMTDSIRATTGHTLTRPCGVGTFATDSHEMEAPMSRITWDEPTGCSSPRGWLMSGGTCVGNYLDYGPDHYRTGHTTDIGGGRMVSFCQPDQQCKDCQPGNVHAVRYPGGPRNEARSWRYFETIADARNWIETGKLAGQPA